MSIRGVFAHLVHGLKRGGLRIVVRLEEHPRSARLLRSALRFCPPARRMVWPRHGQGSEAFLRAGPLDPPWFTPVESEAVRDWHRILSDRTRR